MSAQQRPGGRVQIVVDETACLTEATAAEYGITVVPLGVAEVDGEATTSAIGPLPLCAAYARALERGGDAGVVALHLGKGLSATWSNAVAAAAVLDRVHVVDSPMVGAGMGAAAIAAAKKAATGADLDECLAVAEDVLERNRLWLYVPKLEPLRRGGRISTGQAVLSTALAIKPIVGIQDGTLGLVAKCRTEAKVLDKLVDLAAAEAAGRPAHVLLQHRDARERVEELHAMLSLELAEGTTFDIVDLPAALVTHTGPGAYAVGLVVAEELGAAAEATGGSAGGTAVGTAAGTAAGTTLGGTVVGGSTAGGSADDARGPSIGDPAAAGEPAGGEGDGDVVKQRGAAADRDASQLFTTVAAKLPTWSENRRMAMEKAEQLAHAIAELARRDRSDPEGAAFGADARAEAARKAAEKAAERANGGAEAESGAGNSRGAGGGVEADAGGEAGAGAGARADDAEGTAGDGGKDTSGDGGKDTSGDGGEGDGGGVEKQ